EPELPGRALEIDRLVRVRVDPERCFDRPAAVACPASAGLRCRPERSSTKRSAAVGSAVTFHFAPRWPACFEQRQEQIIRVAPDRDRLTVIVANGFTGTDERFCDAFMARRRASSSSLSVAISSASCQALANAGSAFRSS